MMYAGWSGGLPPRSGLWLAPGGRVSDRRRHVGGGDDAGLPVDRLTHVDRHEGRSQSQAGELGRDPTQGVDDAEGHAVTGVTPAAVSSPVTDAAI